MDSYDREGDDHLENNHDELMSNLLELERVVEDKLLCLSNDNKQELLKIKDLEEKIKDLEQENNQLKEQKIAILDRVQNILHKMESQESLGLNETNNFDKNSDENSDMPKLDLQSSNIK